MPLSDIFNEEAEQLAESSNRFREKDCRYKIHGLHIRHAAYLISVTSILLSVSLIVAAVVLMVYSRYIKQQSYQVLFIAQLKLEFYDTFDVFYFGFLSVFILLNIGHVALTVHAIKAVATTRRRDLWPELLCLLTIIGVLCALLISVMVFLLTYHKCHWMIMSASIALGTFYAVNLAVLTKTFRYLIDKQHHFRLIREAEEARRAVKFLGVPNDKL